MKILHIISSPAAGGAEVYVKDLTKALANNGEDVYVGFLDRAIDTARSINYEEQFLSDLDQAGILYFFIGHEARKRPWLGAWRVRQFVKNNHIDIYHSHLPFGIIFGMFLDIPRFYTHHSIEPRANRFIYACFNRMVSGYIGISKVCAEKLASYTRRQVTIIFNGVDAKKIAKKTRSHQPGSKLNIIAIGRITPQKNFFLLVDAVALLPTSLQEMLNIAIAGEGSSDYTQSLIDYIKSKKLQNTIILLGNRNDISDQLINAELFVMSSDWEGLPIALIEATLSGLPCLVTSVGGCAEIIDICGNGLAVPPKNAQAYADALWKLCTEPKLLEQYSQNAINKSLQLSIDTSCSKHIKLYKSFMKSPT